MRLTKSEYYELPTKYNQTIVRLLMQSPRCIFAYWDVSEDVVNNFSSYGSFLKIVNITKNYSYDIPVDPYTNNYYIHVEDTNCDYRVELCMFNSKKIVNLYSSNVLTVPSSSPDCTEYQEEVVFRSYLCLANTDKFKVFIPKHFVNQSHTEFEGVSSSDRYMN